MKKIILLLLVVFIASCSTQSNLNRFYKNYSQENHVMTLRAPMLLGALFLDSEYADLVSRGIKSLRFMRIGELEDTRKDVVQRDLANALSRDGFTPWFTMNENNARINVLTRERMGATRNVTVTWDVGREMYVLNAQTNLSENELTKLLRSVNIGNSNKPKR
ncbi:MAG: hypothetical protein Q4F57_06250 [Weeksellaceae bacterium]|nr:hypothetical protein [Weeksellaceae bacterium]